MEETNDGIPERVCLDVALPAIGLAAFTATLTTVCLRTALANAAVDDDLDARDRAQRLAKMPVQRGLIARNDVETVDPRKRHRR
jgi:hypothetical protein